MTNKPPFKITPEIIRLVSKIERLLGLVDASTAARPEPQLRKQNRIRTINDSLAIEGNTLSLEQVTAIFENKRVIGPKREILEVSNAICAYEKSADWKTGTEKDFLTGHRILMKGLIDDPGSYRRGSVGVLKGSKVSHVAPPAKLVPVLMDNLFDFIAASTRSKDSPLIFSAVAHYEIEFIHPFGDGNGRMGRLWHHLILAKYHPAFEFIPFESLIRANQKKYYATLEKCDRAGSSEEFIVFSLKLIIEAIHDLLNASPKRRMTLEERRMHAKEKFSQHWFARKDYMNLFPGISAPTASRDLASFVKMEIVICQGTKSEARYRFKLGR